jgi:hypothetical protein
MVSSYNATVEQKKQGIFANPKYTK